MNGTAMMTMQILIRLPVHSEIGITVRTLRLPATTATNQYGRITTTIQENEYLFFFSQALFDFFNQMQADAMLLWRYL